MSGLDICVLTPGFTAQTSPSTRRKKNPWCWKWVASSPAPPRPRAPDERSPWRTEGEVCSWGVLSLQPERGHGRASMQWKTSLPDTQLQRVQGLRNGQNFFIFFRGFCPEGWAAPWVPGLSEAWFWRGAGRVCSGLKVHRMLVDFPQSSLCLFSSMYLNRHFYFSEVVPAPLVSLPESHPSFPRITEHKYTDGGVFFSKTGMMLSHNFSGHGGNY